MSWIQPGQFGPLPFPSNTVRRCSCSKILAAKLSIDSFQGRWRWTLFLRFAVGLATALSALHKKELIHKDVKPANVLVDPAAGHVRLMGFGIASRLPRERQGPEPPEFIAGTLALHGPRADWTNESLDRFAERPLCSRRDALRNADRDASIHDNRSDGVGALPHRPTAGAALREA